MSVRIVACDDLAQNMFVTSSCNTFYVRGFVSFAWLKRHLKLKIGLDPMVIFFCLTHCVESLFVAFYAAEAVERVFFHRDTRIHVAHSSLTAELSRTARKPVALLKENA